MSSAAPHTGKSPYRRLLLGFNHHAECRAVFDFAAQVSRVADVELSGVFVEDQDLLDMARLPFSMELLAASRQTRNLDFESIERDMRAIAMQMQNALRKLAERAQRHYSFRTVRGHLLRALVTQADPGDLILLRTACDLWRGVKPSLSGPVMLLEPPGSSNGVLAALARAIAHDLKQDFILVKTYHGPESVRHLHAGLLIASLSLFDTGSSWREIERFVEAAPCPVLLAPAGV